MALFNAEQSSIYNSYNPASKGIDGDWDTASSTDRATGTHWWQVSMTDTIVYRIVLKAGTSNSDVEIAVSLYSGETLAGQCESHTGSYRSTETLSCAAVTADRVRLTISSTQLAHLFVFEIKITRVLTITIGLYLLSARIVSSKTMRVSRWCRVYGSALIINHI